ncbi:MAG: hypothetical protein AVDCRST_MAG69-1390 [uncultured Solirubrobacteraceae bacterium]|uniref:Uncharacterized protein n=1 Tax=uncultured Solirubrobacteraceae bacterium TaxID=1162706 RepID=A0A6J4S8V5_9ACTN|nr:MAG: hypothetical protein AVDCRST_MAG69-1390 [uncultured Solirubrobacteraceae bacterium]
MSGEPQLTEDQIRALEAEMERITVDDVLLQTIVSLLNLAVRKAGLAAPPGEGPAPDIEQLGQAIEGVRALLPVIEARHADKLGPVRDTLSQLQVFYAQQTGAEPGAGAGGAAPGGSGAGAPDPAANPATGDATGPGTAQRSGRLWVPGQ